MQESKGHCKHGEFNLTEGCPECIQEEREQRELEAEGETTLLETSEAEASGEEVPVEEPVGETAVALRPGADVEAMDYYNEALKLLEYAEGRVIATTDDVKLATDDLSIISRLKTAMNNKRKSLLDPLKLQSEAIRDTYNYLMAPVLEADKVTRKKVLDYQTEQERQRQEAEDIARVERETAERKAALTGEPVVVPEVVEAPPAVPDRYHAEMGTMGKAVIHKWEVIDFALIPDTYKKIDAGAVTNIVKASKGKIVIPGIKIWSEDTLRVTTNKE